MQDNNDKAGTSLTEHMEPLQTVTFTTTSNLGDNNANSSSQLMVSLYLSIIRNKVYAQCYFWVGIVMIFTQNVLLFALGCSAR